MKTILAALILCFLALSPAHAGQKGIGQPCNSDNSTVDFDTLAQCNGSTLIKAPLMLGAVASPPYATTACDAAKAGMLQYTGGVVQYCNGSAWSTMGSSSGTGGQSMVSGWPDAIVCNFTTPIWGVHILPAAYMPFSGDGNYYYREAGVIGTYYNSSKNYVGSQFYSGGWTTAISDCDGKSIDQLISSGRAFNFTNGGANGAAAMADGTAGAPGLYFSADTNTGLYRPTTDTIGIATGGAERLRVTATGSVGIGTASPTSQFSITGNMSAVGSIGINRNPDNGSIPSGGNSSWARYQMTPTQNYLSIESFNTSGTPVGGINLSGTNGYVGIGITSPDRPLDVNGGGRFRSDSGGQAIQIFGRSSDNFSWAPIVYDSTGSSYVGGLHFTPTQAGINIGSGLTGIMTWYSSGAATLAGTLTQNSDLRLKRDTVPLTKALDKITSLQGVTFHWKDKEKDQSQQMGVIAQDVQKVFPQLVRSDDLGILSVNYSGFVAPLIEAVKELKSENEALHTQNAVFEARLDALEARGR